MGIYSKKRKIMGAGPCNCKPLEDGRQVSPNTLICPHCNFVATVPPVFTARLVSEAEMRRVFNEEWTPDMRVAYKYLFDPMKPEEKKSLQAARTAFFKVEDWKKKGLVA